MSFCCSLTAPPPERTPSHVAHHQPSTSSPLWTHIKLCRRPLGRVPHPPDSASTSTPRTAWATSASPLSKASQGPTPSGSCTSGSSVTSFVTAAQRRLSTPQPRTIPSVPAPPPPCLPPPHSPGLRAILAVCRYHRHLQTSPRRGPHQVPAGPCPPHGGRTRQLIGWQSDLWVKGQWWTSPSPSPPGGASLSCSR